MKSQEDTLIAVAETSVIIRTGLVTVLKRLSDMNVQTVEVTSKEGLQHCMEAHSPQILIVNPQFEGWFDADSFREHYQQPDIKVVALLSSFVDSNRLKGYDECINLFEDGWFGAMQHKARVAPAIEVNVGKWFTPSVGARIGYSGFRAGDGWPACVAFR